MSDIKRKYTYYHMEGKEINLKVMDTRIHKTCVKDKVRNARDRRKYFLTLICIAVTMIIYRHKSDATQGILYKTLII